MLSPHKIHIHKAQLSSHKFTFAMLSSALSKFTFTIVNLSFQTSAIPQLIFSCSCFLGVVSSDVFNRGGQVCLACISDMKAVIRFFPFCFFFFHPSIACFCFFCWFIFTLLLHVFLLSFAHVSYFLFYASLRLRFSLASLYQISLALLRQVSLALLCFLPVVLASHATWRFSLSFASFENYVTWTSLKANCEWKNVAFQWYPENYHTRTPVARFIVLQAVKLLSTDFMM